MNEARRHRIAGSEPGVELAVLEWPGDGPPMLLHHANGFCGALWEPVVEALDGRYRAFAVDARGHGDSSRPEGDELYGWERLAHDLVHVADFALETTGAPAIELAVGHSFGGTLTMTAAALRPGLLRRALLVDPVILPPPGSALARAFSGGNTRAERARKRRDRWASRDEARAFFAGKPLFEHWTERALDLYVDEGLATTDDGVVLKCPGRVEAAVFEGARGFDPYAFAAKAALPVRLLRAESGDFPRGAYDALCALLPDGELGDIEGGHLVVMERPDAVARAILAFSDGTAH